MRMIKVAFPAMVLCFLVLLSSVEETKGRTLDSFDLSQISSPENLLQEEKAKRHSRCRGNFSQRKYDRLNRICEDCYNLFRSPLVFTMCKEDCFQTEIFEDCLSALALSKASKADYKSDVQEIAILK